MTLNKFTSVAVAMAATLSVSVLAGCPSGTPGVVTPSGSPNPSAVPTATASTTPSGTPTGTPANPSATAASAAPSALPSTPDTSSRATIQGIVFDDLGSRLDGVTVVGKVLGSGTFSNGSDALSVSTQIGSYALNGAPTGATILITATKAGMTTRQQTIVPLSNLQGNTTLNRVSFGEGTDRVYPLSDKPEVTSFTPAKDATGVAANTTFTLTFSEPVNTADVESNFAIYVSGPANAGTIVQNAANSYTLSASNTKLNYTFDPNKDDGSTTGTATFTRVTAAPIYDSASFTAAWSNNNQTVTFTFRPGAKLPTDKDSSKIPQYAVSFKDGSIRDAAGTGRSDSWFRVSPAQVGRVGYKFTVAADTTAPSVSTITAVNKDDADGTLDDRIRVQYNKSMALFPGNNGGASVPAATDAGYAALTANYLYYVSTAGGTTYPDNATAAGQTAAAGTWGAFDANAGVGDPTATYSGAVARFGGSEPLAAKFYDGDATRSTVELSTLKDDPTVANSTRMAFTTGNNVWVNARSVIIDPAANTISTSNNINIRSGIAQ